MNPILERELRARFRGRRSFLMLTLFVLVEIGVFVLLFASSVLNDPGRAILENTSPGRQAAVGASTRRIEPRRFGPCQALRL